MSKRYVDENGYLEVKDNPLTRVGVFQYLGSEINAPEPNRVYSVYRPAEEVEAAAESFKLMPFINDHEWLGRHGTPAEKKGTLGVIGEQVRFEHPYLLGNIKIHSDIAQDLIASGKIELSAGYACRYEESSGVFDGQVYDYIQRDLRANHLALVEQGRTGKDVRILDGSIITIDTKELLPMTIEELLAAIAALSEEDKAKLLAGLAPTTDEEKTDDAAEVDTEAAESASETAEEAAEQLEVAAEAASEAAATGEPAAVAEAEAAVEVAETKIDAVKTELDEAATMDAMTKKVMERISKRDKLAKRLQAHVGTFDHSMMTIEQVGQYGCKKLGLTAAKGTEVIALDAALQVRVADSQKKALDSKPVSRGDVASKFWSDK